MRWNPWNIPEDVVMTDAPVPGRGTFPEQKRRERLVGSC